MKIPGVGSVTALSFFSAIENPHRFKRSADVGAYLGLVPRLRQSGSMSHSGRITRAGNKMTRTHLYMSACVLMSRALEQTQLGDWAKSLQERIRFNKARVALARKLAVVMLTIWKTGSTFKCYPDVAQLKR
jgi:transposase